MEKVSFFSDNCSPQMSGDFVSNGFTLKELCQGTLLYYLKGQRYSWSGKLGTNRLWSTNSPINLASHSFLDEVSQREEPEQMTSPRSARPTVQIIRKRQRAVNCLRYGRYSRHSQASFSLHRRQRRAITIMALINSLQGKRPRFGIARAEIIICPIDPRLVSV